MSGLEEQGLGAESEDLFRAAKKALSPSMADRDRVRARLALKIGVGAAVATVATTSSKAAASAAGAGAASAAATKTTAAAGIPLFAKIVAPLVIASAVGTVAVAPHVVSRASTTTTTTTATAAATTLAAKPPPPVTNAKADPAPAAAVSIDDLPNAETSPRAPHVRTAPKAASRAQPTDDTSEEARAREEEAALALQIDAALRANDMARAARLADEHQRRFPNGLLSEEREGARVLIRCSSTPSAAIASEFLQAHPRSPMRARILAACATERVVE